MQQQNFLVSCCFFVSFFVSFCPFTFSFVSNFVNVSFSFCSQFPIPLTHFIPLFILNIYHSSLHTHSGQDEVEQGECSTEPQRRKMRSASDFPPWQPRKNPCFGMSVHYLQQGQVEIEIENPEKLCVPSIHSVKPWLQVNCWKQHNERKDQRLLLIQIEDRDLVASDVCYMYHHLYYNEYTPFLTRPDPSDETPIRYC